MAALETPMSDFPAKGAAAVTPSDSADLVYRTRALYVGTGGNISVNMAGTGAAVVFTGVPSGSVLPISVTRVLSTDTTASDIVALW